MAEFTGIKKEYFDSMNRAWEILLPSVQDPKEYKKVMGKLFVMFFKEIPNKFSDEWWQTTIDSFLDYSKTYKGNPLEDFVGELVIGLLNFREHEYKLHNDSADLFYNDIEGAFTNERDRITQAVSG